MNDLLILKQVLLIALKTFLHKDSYLLAIDVQEETISHRLAFHIEKSFEKPKYDLPFKVQRIESLLVDCEYNKHGDEPKALADIIKKYPEKKSNIVRPDIVLHGRNSPTNLIVIEIKKKKSKDKQYAKDKVQAFIESSYAYQFGLYIEFNSGEDYSISKPIATATTFSKDNYKDPNEKLIGMLNASKAQQGASDDVANQTQSDDLQEENTQEEHLNEFWSDRLEMMNNYQNLREYGWWYPDEEEWY